MQKVRGKKMKRWKDEKHYFETTLCVSRIHRGFPGIYDNIEQFLSQIWNNEYKNITGIDLFFPPDYTKGLYKIALKIQIGF